MNLPTTPRPAGGAASRRRIAAYSLAELVITLALLGLVMTAVLLCQLYGLQMHNFVRPKLDNASFARSTLSHLIEEVRSAQFLEVGQGTLAKFVAAGSTNAQRGNAMRIHLASDTNKFIYYYQDPADQTLKRVALGASNAVAVARSVTNSVVFTFRDFTGSIQTNDQNNTSVDVLLDMRQDSARQGVSDSYQVRTRITRRAI